jgi:HD-GYP domain-containing protein (c-di-GMP phosphodiesterase class II)
VELFRRHEEMVLAFIRSLVTTLDAKDSYTRGHSERVALVAQRIAIELNLSRPESEAVYQAGLLHDIGKIGVDDALLHKKSMLTSAEFRKITKHPEIGHTIISELKNLNHILPGILHHHERFDGRGYPAKLAGRDIPQMARILSVADAFDAMGSDRPYRTGMNREEIEQVLLRGAGSQWDPEVVQAFLSARFEIYRLWSRAIERQNQEV